MASLRIASSAALETFMGNPDRITFDVFKGTRENCIWLGTLTGLNRAIELMNRMAERQPDSYFVFSSLNSQVVATIEPHFCPSPEREASRMKDVPSHTSFGSGLPTFDIFQGHYRDKDPKWLEAVEGLGSARDRMKQIATDSPGAYFVFSKHDRLVLDILDTTKSLLRPNVPSKKAVVA
jgi:hypothetical protein